jgi:AcrR family transcriptional regulator
MEVTSTSPSRRAERKERLRGEILAAASKMFANRGYEAVTLREIAKEIGYTHAVIYQHFPDKGHILAELSRETIGLLIQNFDAIAAQHPAPKERLFATSRGLIDMVVAHTWWYTIFGLATLMVIQGVVPDLPDQTLVVEQTIATLWAGVQAVPRLPKSAITKRSGRSSASKH